MKGLSPKPLPSADLLREWFAYSKTTGIVTWKKMRGSRALLGSEVGSIGVVGYRQVGFAGRDYYVHRIIWKLVTGDDPGELEIDHRNHNLTDNRWANLRLATKSNNAYNKRLEQKNTSGIKGVSWDSRYGMWHARVRSENKTKHIGYFHDKERAGLAVKEAREDLHKEFTNHG